MDENDVMDPSRVLAYRDDWLMDEITDRDLREALRGASEEAAREQDSSMASVAAALRARVAGPNNPLSEIVTALEYATRAAPSPVSDPAVLSLWARALAHSPRPLVGARFADLLWSARYGDTPHEWAQRAVDSYLAARYDKFGHVLEIAEGLQRALGIATEIDDRPRTAAVVAALVDLADRSISGEPRSSGVVLSILAFLADQPPTARPVELAALVERALDRYRDDGWLLEATLDIKATLVEPAAREQLHIAEVEAFARLARDSVGFLRHAQFEHAIALAERHDLATLAEQLRAEVDGRVNTPVAPARDPAPAAEIVEPRVPVAPPRDPAPAAEIVEPRVPVAPPRDPAPAAEIVEPRNPVAPPSDPAPAAEIVEPRNPVVDFMDRVVGNDSLGEALARFGASLPTEGHDDAPDDADLQRMTYFGGLAVNLLARIRARYGPVRAARVWFECPLIDPAIASGIADGIELYESGDFNAAASALAIELEQIARTTATAAGVTVAPRRDGANPALATPWISDVLAALEGALYEPSRRYVRALLSETTPTVAPSEVELAPTGGVTPQDAALLVHAACHLRLLQPVSGTVN